MRTLEWGGVDNLRDLWSIYRESYYEDIDDEFLDEEEGHL